MHPRITIRRSGFTLVELLVVIAIIGLLISILLPSLQAARRQSRAAKCLANLHVLGHGISLYANDNGGALMPSRLPNLGTCDAYAMINGGIKYRPTFIAVMSLAVSAPPFMDPKRCKNEQDIFGEAGDRQNYAYPVYVCPEVPEWTDERNGCYGWNYQFLGNSRLFDEQDPTSYKHWPIQLSAIRHPARTVAVGDCMGTAASWPTWERQPYGNNARDAERFGNEGFNLDPPRVDPINGEMANFDSSPQSRSAADPRHNNKATILWLDGHASPKTLADLGYEVEPNGVIPFGDVKADNSQWSGTGENVAWTPDFTHQ